MDAALDGRMIKWWHRLVPRSYLVHSPTERGFNWVASELSASSDESDKAGLIGSAADLASCAITTV